MRDGPIRIEPHRPGPTAEWGALAVFVVLCLGVGAVAGGVTAAFIGPWYRTLDQPPLAPPDWVFAPVWTTLYVMMGVAAWRVWRRRLPGRRRALTLFGIQLFLNPLWSVLFFGLRSPTAALGDLIGLWLVLCATTWTFWTRDCLAGMLMVPYLVWVTYAGYLNGGLVALN